MDCNVAAIAKAARQGSNIPLQKWLFAARLITTFEGAISEQHLQKALIVSYKTAWLMKRRIRHEMSYHLKTDSQ